MDRECLLVDCSATAWSAKNNKSAV